jgi:hypothetical protein
VLSGDGSVGGSGGGGDGAGDYPRRAKRQSRRRQPPTTGDRDRGGQVEAANPLFCRSSYATGCRGTIMKGRAIALVLSCAALSGCGGISSIPSFSLPSFNKPSFSVPGFTAPGMPVHVTSVPPGAEASFGRDGQSCTTPCTLTAPNGPGTFNVSFKLNGYQPQSVPFVESAFGQNFDPAGTDA